MSVTTGSSGTAQAGGAQPDGDAAASGGASVPHIPPPLYYGVAFVIAILLHGVTVPLAIGGRPATMVVGAVVLAAGMALSIAGVIAVVRHHTTIVPHHAVSSLLTSGVYRISRNPMYMGLAVVDVGGALLAGSWWPLATLPLALLAIRRFVISPEERYLSELFGQTYVDYQTRTRRWI
jgi:protein-S-isoprenylcysteine O-methyltransferase Ste14